MLKRNLLTFVWLLLSVCACTAADRDDATSLAKVTHIGARPVNLLVGCYHNPGHPTGGARNQTRVQINFMFPTGMK